MKWTDEQLAQRLKKLRTQQKLTQQKLTEKLVAAGCPMTWTQLARLEKGTRSLRVVEAAALCDIFGVSMNTLAGLESSPEVDLRRAINGLRMALDTCERACAAGQEAEQAMREIQATLDQEEP
jgi:transcriptional regulator with XRE-family HTH domain